MKKIISFAIIFLIVLSTFSMLAPQIEAEPDLGMWVRKADMPTPRRDSAAVAFNGKIYVIGGINASDGGNFVGCDIVETYDPLTDSWTAETPMPGPKGGDGGCGPGAVVINNKIYVVGGDNRIFRYDLGNNQWDAIEMHVNAGPRFDFQNPSSQIQGAIGMSVEIYPAKSHARNLDKNIIGT